MDDTKTENKDQKTPSVPKKNKGKKLLFWILAIIACLMLITLAFTAWFLAGILDHEPLPTVLKVPDFIQYQNCINKIQQKIFNNNTGSTEDQTLEFTKAEINALLDSSTQISRIYLAKKIPDIKICDVSFEKGALYANISQKIPFSTPFGRYMNIKIQLIPRIKNKHLYVKIRSLSLGTMQLSGMFVQEYIDTKLIEFETSKHHKMLIKTLKSLQLDENKIIITFNPQQIQILLMHQALQIFSDKKNDSNTFYNLLNLLQ